MPRGRKTSKSIVYNQWKIGIYIRLSREDKDGEGHRLENRGSKHHTPQNVTADSSKSIVEQDKILTEWVMEYFKDENYIIVGYYVDDGLSGTDDTREDFQRLMEDVKRGKINCIVVKTLSRAFRNYADQGRYLEQVFPSLGIRFISSGNPFVDSFSDPEAINSGMEIPINGLMNDRYAAKTSADIRRTFDAKRKRGEFIGAFAPYGYIKNPEDKNSLIIDEEAAQYVRDIFHWFVNEGMSKRGIAFRLNDLGILNPSAYKRQVLNTKYQNPGMKRNDGLWSGTMIQAILKNQVYIGNMVQGRHRVISYKVHKQLKVPENEWFIVENTHEAIIDKTLYAKAQALHSQDTRTAPGKRKNYIFSGLLRCSDCKKIMRRKASKGFVYYYCRTVTDKGLCIKRSIREDKLLNAVYDAIFMQIALVQSISDTLDTIEKQPTTKTQTSRLEILLKQRKDELNKITNASQTLYLDWKNGDITKADYKNMKTSFDEKAGVLSEAVRKIQEEIDSLADSVTLCDPYLATFLKFKNIKEINRGIVVALIDTIYIHKDGRITIDFLFDDEIKNVIDRIENKNNLNSVNSSVIT